MTKTRRRRGGRLKNATLKAEKEAKRAQRKEETQILKDVKAQKKEDRAKLKEEKARLKEAKAYIKALKKAQQKPK